LNLFDKLKYPDEGNTLKLIDGNLNVPNDLIIPYIMGDGIGNDITTAMKRVIDASVKYAYKNEKEIKWFRLYAGEDALEKYGELLPKDTINAIEHFLIAIKGPLTTPVGEGFRSLNVSLRQIFDLYSIVRPCKYITGIPSPVKTPEKINMVVFREATEDVYSGIEWPEGTVEAKKIIDFIKKEMNLDIKSDSGIGIKPISITRTKRLMRRAIKYAIDQNQKSITIMHKGNIMKYTEGAFRNWCYEVAKEEFSNSTSLENENQNNKIIIKDRIADSMFQQIISRPNEYDVIVTPNLNGDYIADALAIQIGGLGIAPSANIGDKIAIFEATHGSAPKYKNKDMVNPTALINCGIMMLEYIGWNKPAELLSQAIEQTIKEKKVTYDLARLMSNSNKLKCSEYATAIIENLNHKK